MLLDIKYIFIYMFGIIGNNFGLYLKINNYLINKFIQYYYIFIKINY